MPTAAQVKKLLKPLLEKHRDLVMLGRGIHVTPIRHISRMVLVEPTSNANRCRPRYFVGLLAQGPMSPWHAFLKHPPPEPALWFWDDPNTVPYLIDAIETQALPILRATGSLEAFEKLTESPWSRWSIDIVNLAAVLFHAATGRLEYARDRARRIRRSWEQDHPTWPAQGRRYNAVLLRLADALEDGDRAGVARSLHDLERANLEEWKLEPYWEPTPFPLERRS